jgi:hypothetical protein
MMQRSIDADEITVLLLPEVERRPTVCPRIDIEQFELFPR